MTRVPGSSISASITSGVVMSASLPVESATRKPMPRAVQLISTEKPKPPLCVTSDTAAGEQIRLLEHRAEAGVEPRSEIDQALAIRADQANAGLGRCLAQLGFECGAGGAGLAIAGAQHDAERDAGSAAGAHRLDRSLRRHRDQREVTRLVDVGNAGVAAKPVDLLVFRIDRIDARRGSRTG